MHSVEPRHVVVSPQQLASRHASHVGSPLVRPHEPPPPLLLPPPPLETAPHAVPHDVAAHVEIASSFFAPAGCAVSHADAHAASLHA
jgi:hypothetical protein